MIDPLLLCFALREDLPSYLACQLCLPASAGLGCAPRQVPHDSCKT
jgi:hypothetical protein